MYSGTTLTKYSGRILGAHQKIDRVSRRHLSDFLLDNNGFPYIKQILHFEGRNGPDGVKLKSPAKDEPWHYFDPFDDNDNQLIDLIEGHYEQLVEELKSGNMERAAFDASWLAHAIVDGLTPAHHFPYEQKLSELRGGLDNESRNSTAKKLIIPGKTPTKLLINNWKMWGGKGLMTTHGTFEWGVATLIAPLKLNEAMPTHEELIHIEKEGLAELFRRVACEIAMLDLYQRYYETGWTGRLAGQVRHVLAPTIVRTVTSAWYLAAKEAGKVSV